MNAIFLIIAVVGGVSLYDYYVSRTWQQVTSSVRNDVVFEKRNRQYGAFVIRRDYDQTLFIIMASIFLCIGSLSIAYIYLNKSPQPAVLKRPVMQEITTLITFEARKEPLEESPSPLKESTSLKTEQFIEPKVEDKKIADPLVKTQDVPQNTTVSQTASTGTGSEPFGNGTGTGDGNTGGTHDDGIDNEPQLFPDVEAEFPGGYTAMMKFIQTNLIYPQSGIEFGAQGKCYLRFVVDKDGGINSVKVLRGILGCPDCDREAVRVLKSMPYWKPGKIKGREVATFFDLPINFTLE
ncbi:MAG: energy transducer TonB [Flavobacteriia bacterium]|jgi:protein TonB